MATNNSVNTSLFGETGTGAFVGSELPTFTQIAFNPVTQGIVGMTSNAGVQAGYVGEYITSVIQFASRVSVISSTPTTVTSISLGAGEWDVWGTVQTAAGGGAVTNAFVVGISFVANTFNNSDSSFVLNTLVGVTTGANGNAALPTGTMRIALDVTTTVYLIGQANFTGGISLYGFIGARRMH